MDASNNYQRGMHWLIVVVAAWTLFMISAGGMVTSQNAGDAVPDWPLSYGSLLPPMVGNVFWEHGHRLVGMALGLMTIAMTVWIAGREPRRWVRVLGYIALPWVCFQGALGGLRVKLISSPAVQDFFFTNPTGENVETLRVGVTVFHTATAQGIFSLMAVLAIVTSRRWLSAGEPLRSPDVGRLRNMGLVAIGLVLVQVVLGAIRRQTDGTIWFHAIGATAVTLMLAAIAWLVFKRFREVRPLVRSARLLIVLVAVQLTLGVVSWLLTNAAIERSLHLPMLWGSVEAASAILTAHLALGASLLAACVVLVVRAHRYVAPLEAQAVNATTEGRLATA